jgi:hypothetical protein
MKKRIRDPKRIWPEWDAQLNSFGEWLLVGCISSACLPPVPGLAATTVIVYVGLTKTEPTADLLFSERSRLTEKEKAGTLTPEEATRLDSLLGALRRTQKKRDYRVYIACWVFLTATVCYLCSKFFVLPLRGWFY